MPETELPENIQPALLQYLAARYFLNQMVHFYHFPAPFIFNTGAFIQSVHNIVQLLHTACNKGVTLKSWWDKSYTEIKQHPQFEKLTMGRHGIVHRGSFQSRSNAHIGLFRGGKSKLTFGQPVPIFQDSIELFHVAKKILNSMTSESLESLHEDGIELGVKREWIVEEIGPEEIVSVCRDLLFFYSGKINELHEIFNADHQTDWNEIDTEFQLLTETKLVSYERVHFDCLMPVHRGRLPDFIREYYYPSDKAH